MEFKPLKWLLCASVAVFVVHAAMAQDAAKVPDAAELAPASTAPAQATPAPDVSSEPPVTTGGTAATQSPPPPAAPVPGTATDVPDTAAEAALKPAGDPEAEATQPVRRRPSVLGRVICDSTTSEITTVREARFNTGNVWDIVYAKDGMDVFADAVSLDNNIVIAVGSYTKDKDDKIYHPLLVKFDERLKPVWEVREETSDLQTIHRMIKTKDGITVLGDINTKNGNGIYIASYDDNGKVRGKPVPIYERGGDLDAKSFVQASDGSGYIITAQFIDAKDQENQNGILYKISKAGKIIWKRSYKTGRSTAFNNVQVALDGSYIVTGQIVLEGNVSGAWLLRVDENGALKWQRSYPRGLAASFQAAAQTKEGDFILTGKARPLDYDGKGLTAWVMKTDSTGTPMWQRYFRGAYSYEAPDLIVYEDGRATVLINGEGQDSDHRSHARLLTFSPHGQVQIMEDFTEGQNSSAHRLVSGMNGERIAIGYAQTSFGDDQEGNEASAAPDYTFDGWLLAAVPLDTFEDPCVRHNPQMSPILP